MRRCHAVDQPGLRFGICVLFLRDLRLVAESSGAARKPGGYARLGPRQQGWTPDETVSAMGSDDQFVMDMIACQRRLYAYVLSVVFDKERARDILQQTNLVLLEKKAEFEPGTNFGAWACRVAYFEVLADRRRRTRDRLLFDDEVLASLAKHAEEASAHADQRVDALETCLEQLSAEHQALIRERYSPGGSVAEMAAAASKSAAAISSILYRLRSTLVDCIHKKLEGPAAS